jgi:hypothetical protein
MHTNAYSCTLMWMHPCWYLSMHVIACSCVLMHFMPATAYSCMVMHTHAYDRVLMHIQACRCILICTDASFICHCMFMHVNAYSCIPMYVHDMLMHTCSCILMHIEVPACTLMHTCRSLLFSYPVDTCTCTRNRIAGMAHGTSLLVRFPRGTLMPGAGPQAQSTRPPASPVPGRGAYARETGPRLTDNDDICGICQYCRKKPTSGERRGEAMPKL